jgi:hypothetical protein
MSKLYVKAFIHHKKRRGCKEKGKVLVPNIGGFIFKRYPVVKLTPHPPLICKSQHLSVIKDKEKLQRKREGSSSKICPTTFKVIGIPPLYPGTTFDVCPI